MEPGGTFHAMPSTAKKSIELSQAKIPEQQRKQIEFIDQIYNKVVLKQNYNDMDRLKERYSNHAKNEGETQHLPINLMNTDDKENVYQSYN